jgi:hypothetical protein
MRLRNLTPDQLCGLGWQYGPAVDSTVWGTLRFSPAAPWPDMAAEGRISGFRHPNERRWRLSGGFLLLMNEAGRVTNRFDRMEAAADGQPVLFGQHVLEGGGAHRLHAVAPLRTWPARPAPLSSVRRLSNPARPLLVIFNSLGNPVKPDGRVRWEYRALAADPRIDVLRFAEPAAPASWFLRPEATVRAALAAAAAGRPRVALMGNSSGGYAAIRFGHWLHGTGLVPDVRTVSANPQTAHSPPVRRHLLVRDWDGFLPTLMDDDVLRLLGRDDLDLAPLLTPPARPRSRVEHLVLFDADNPAERFYAGLIAGRPGVVLRPVALGLSHPRGIGEIARQGLMGQAVDAALHAPSPPQPGWRSMIARLRTRASG